MVSYLDHLEPMKLFDTKKYNPKFYIFSGVGSALILVLSLGATYWLWQQGIKENIFPETFSTSVMLSDTLASMNTAAPWALISINWLACRTLIKGWRRKVKRWFE